MLPFVVRYYHFFNSCFSENVNIWLYYFWCSCCMYVCVFDVLCFQWVIPEMVSQCLTTMLMLVSMHWFIFLLNLPVAAWNIYRSVSTRAVITETVHKYSVRQSWDGYVVFFTRGTHSLSLAEIGHWKHWAGLDSATHTHTDIDSKGSIFIPSCFQTCSQLWTFSGHSLEGLYVWK